MFKVQFQKQQQQQNIFVILFIIFNIISIAFVNCQLPVQQQSVDNFKKQDNNINNVVPKLNHAEEIRQASYVDYLRNLTPQDYYQITKGIIKGLQNGINPQNGNICSQIIIYNMENSLFLSNELPLMFYQYNSTQIKTVVSNFKTILKNFSNLNQNNVCKFDLITDRVNFYNEFIDQFGADQLILREKAFFFNNKQYFSSFLRAIAFDMYFGTYEDVGYNIGGCMAVFLNTPYA